MKIEEAKKKVEYYQNGTGWVTSEFIIDILDQLDQPKLKIPQFMLDWVDNSRELDYEFEEWFYYNNQPREVYEWLNPENKRQADLNALALFTLIVNDPDAVIVEKRSCIQLRF